jgi:hypothetical protein
LGKRQARKREQSEEDPPDVRLLDARDALLAAFDRYASNFFAPGREAHTVTRAVVECALDALEGDHEARKKVERFAPQLPVPGRRTRKMLALVRDACERFLTARAAMMSDPALLSFSVWSLQRILRGIDPAYDAVTDELISAALRDMKDQTGRGRRRGPAWFAAAVTCKVGALRYGPDDREAAANDFGR